MKDFQSKNKYAVLLINVHQSQIEKHNGTKGYPYLNEGLVGVLDEKRRYYYFGEHPCTFKKHLVKVDFTESFVLNMGHAFKLYDSIFDHAHDEDDKDLKERYEVRLLTAKSHIDVKVANLYYAAGQVDRLDIKLTMMKWKEATP